MHRAQDKKLCKLLHNRRAQREARDLDRTQVPTAVKSEAPVSKRVKVSGGETPSSPQSSQRASTAPTFMGSISQRPSAGGSRIQVEQREEPVSPMDSVIKSKIGDLVKFLVRKYRKKLVISKTEMLVRVVRNYGEFFPVIFREASQCMKVVFGIEVIEMDRAMHTYALVTFLGITYDGLMHGARGIPKTGLIISALCIIFLGDNCISEEAFWNVFNKLGFYAGRNHFIFGEPKKLFTEDFVQEGYLEYRLVPNSDPAQHEFLWGPRAHTEIPKMRILEYIAMATGKTPQSYPERYAEALRDEGQRA